MGYNDILWDRRKDLGKGAVIILNMSDGVCQFSDILVNLNSVPIVNMFKSFVS